MFLSEVQKSIAIIFYFREGGVRGVVGEIISLDQCFSTCNFLAKNIGAKAAHKMLVKFTTGLLLSLSLSSRANYLFS